MPDIINITTPDTASKDTPEYRQSMIDKVEGKAPATTPSDALLAGKYKTKEDLTNGLINLIEKGGQSLEAFYKSLESGLGKAGDPKPDPKAPEKTEVAPSPTDAPKADPGKEPSKEADKAPPKDDKAPDTDNPPDLDIPGLVDELNKGNLSEASLKALEAHGVSKQAAPAFVAGQQALLNQVISETHAIVGGKENYSAMLEWAGKNLNASEVDAFNAAVSGDGRQFAIEGLYARYTRANGKPGNIVSPTGAASNGGDVYTSWDQVKTDMAKPEYKKNDAFRRQVQEKLGRSKV
jgi:hypothetical protein